MTQAQTINVPDIGGATSVDVIEILVKPGEEIEQNAPLVTLESDKASMEIPAPFAGKVVDLLLKIGDKVSEGTPILTLATAQTSSQLAESKQVQPSTPAPVAAPIQAPSAPLEQAPEIVAREGVYAGPAVRRLARELGLDLAALQGTGRKSRVTREDVVQYFKSQSVGSAIPMVTPEQAIDFSQFGPIEAKPLNKIKRLTAQAMHRSWITVPHVTQFDEVDITELEAFRQAQQKEAEKEGYKLTLLPFLIKAVTKALKLHPQFNASLSPAGDSLIYKQYYHLGFAVDTPLGLMVPVVKNANLLSVGEIAKEMQRLSSLAKDKGLMPADMKGGSFTVSSLGGIGGGFAFTPIVNAPEVAILGVSRAVMKPVYDGERIVPRLMLPLSLSYDHRVIDGAEGARFMRDLTALVSDIRRIIL